MTLMFGAAARDRKVVVVSPGPKWGVEGMSLMAEDLAAAAELSARDRRRKGEF